VTTNQTKTRIPAPLYAAAGAADLAYRKLRDLQARVAEQRSFPTARELDVEKLRGVAKRNVKAFVVSAQAAQEKVIAGAQVAQEKAVEIYTDLVARGEKVVRGNARETAATVSEIADTAAADVKKTTAAKRTRPAVTK
jgi:heparin binding hemagglutinin HbhA